MVTRGEPTRAAALLVGLLLASSACALVAEDQPGDRPTRATDFDSCPEISLQEVPEGFTLVRRRLRALPDNHMGEVATYRSGRQTLTLYSGPDLYDELEDDSIEEFRRRLFFPPFAGGLAAKIGGPQRGPGVGGGVVPLHR